MTERDIAGYEGLYVVSDKGYVRSLPRMGTKGQVLKGVPYSKPGHLYVRLHKDGKGEARTIHSLVLEAFVGPRPNGMECLHNNGISTDNRKENLRWGTRSENMLDRVKHGTDHVSSRTHCNHGHEFTDDNIRFTPDGYRSCLTCYRERLAREKLARAMLAKPFDDGTSPEKIHTK